MRAMDTHPNLVASSRRVTINVLMDDHDQIGCGTATCADPPAHPTIHWFLRLQFWSRAERFLGATNKTTDLTQSFEPYARRHRPCDQKVRRHRREPRHSPLL